MMGRKIFVSYKYHDDDVYPLYEKENTKVCDYVQRLENSAFFKENIFKGEHKGESMDDFKDSTIWEKLKDKIWDSTVTVVLISPNMREFCIVEGEQWIAQEISYSMKKISRDGRQSKENTILLVVLPDKNGSEKYFKPSKLFPILRNNYEGRLEKCVFTWKEFINNPLDCIWLADDVLFEHQSKNARYFSKLNTHEDEQ